MVVILIATVSVAHTTGMVRTKASLKGELYELRFALEPKRSVDDELSDVIETPVNGQNVARIWVLCDRDGEDVGGEFGGEVRERRHDERDQGPEKRRI